MKKIIGYTIATLLFLAFIITFGLKFGFIPIIIIILSSLALTALIVLAIYLIVD